MAQELNKDVGSPIPPDEAKAWIANYQKLLPPDGTRAVFFGTNIIEQILNQKECVGIRIYFGQDEAGSSRIVLVGAKENGNNIWPSASPDSTPDGITADTGWPCPPRCPEN